MASWLEKHTGQHGLWWLWHIAALTCLVFIVVLLRQEQGQLRAQTEILQQTLQIERARNLQPNYARHAACAGLYLVGMQEYDGPWGLFERITGQPSSVCQEK